MHFYITLTTKCNLECRYCYGKLCDDFGTSLGNFEIDYALPSEIAYSLNRLKEFCEKDSAISIIFYGGEPLLRTSKIREIMDCVKAKRYMIQTNGLLLHNLGKKYLNRFDTILVSVDGNEELTDYYRGNGVYRGVVDNVKLLESQGFCGEVIARMTVMQETDIDRQVWHLLFNDDFPFPAVHWQLDAQFWKNDFNRERFTRWVQEKYNPQIKTLAKKWVDYMERSGVVLKIYPFMGLTQSLLANESSKLRCGAGWSVYNIQTDGNISPCPVMAGMKVFYAGNIWESSPSNLRVISPKTPCNSCEILGLCGGRCLYANATKLWGEEGFRFVCGTVKSLIDALRARLPTIKELISKGRLRLEDFEYTKFNSCEIIP